ncbi:E3 ubiquitin-protein ligase upl4 [Ancistrocladus abbreviatus]
MSIEISDKLMENRGQKRSETGDEMPADKRACSSLEFRPCSSNSSPQTLVNSTSSTMETHEGTDMETSSSSASASGRSEGEGDRDSPDGSGDSDDVNNGDNRHRRLREFQRRRSYGDEGKFKKVLQSLSDEVECSGQLAALTELCELLSFCTENSISSMLSDQLAPILVRFSKEETNPDIVLLAFRAMTYLCDVFPRASAFLVRHDAVPALCERLMVIEYLDLAEQCLQALEKISRDQPLACLQAGATMAVLGYIDFFSTSVQRIALSTVVNICKKLPSECPSPFMEAVPTLCNLLQYEDQQLVENVATCLIKIVDRVKYSPDMLNQLCTQGLVHQATHLIDLNCTTTLSQRIHIGLIELLAKLASGSADAVITLFELNIGSISGDILSSYDFSHGIPSFHPMEKSCNQVHGILKLLNELLPPIVRDKEDQLLESKARILEDRPDILQKFGMIILPVLVQVVNSGANLYVCYGCLCIIHKLVYFSKSDTLLELVKNTNISSFLTGVFTRNDHHILTLALQITETLLHKLSDMLMKSFIKEGVVYAIDALLTPEKCSQFMFPLICGIQSSVDLDQKFPWGEVLRCLCYAYDDVQSPSSSESGTCKLEKDSVQNIAKCINITYFTRELHSSERIMTDILHNLRIVSSELMNLVSISGSHNSCAQHEGKFYSILHQVMAQLNADEPISTFELIESGIIKAMVNYLSDGLYLKQKVHIMDKPTHYCGCHKTFQLFARIAFFSLNPVSEDLPFSLLVRKLQAALSTVESFPVLLGNVARLRGSYATVPNGRSMMHPCFRVRFMREKEETGLCDYSEDVVTVDPFCSIEAIGQYLWPKVKGKKISCRNSAAEAQGQVKVIPIQIPSNSGSVEGSSPDMMESDNICSALPGMQGHADKEVHLSSDVNGETKSECVENVTSSNCTSHGEEVMKNGQSDASCSTEDGLPKLAFYLEGLQLDYSSALYQEILQRRMKSQSQLYNGAKLWSELYTITYRRAAQTDNGSSKECSFLFENSHWDKVRLCHQSMPFLSGIFAGELVSGVEVSSPANDILLLLKSLEMMNRFAHHLMCFEKVNAFAEGKADNLDCLKVLVPTVPQNDFVNNKLTEKLEQQMRDPLSVSIGALPLWCTQLMSTCPFLFSFEARCKYFQLAAFGRSQVQLQLSSHSDTGAPSDRRPVSGSLHRKKFAVSRDHILDSATQMMELHAHRRVVIEVEYHEEVGTGLGPTLEFYTLVCHEFQKAGLGMWRVGNVSSTCEENILGSDSGFVISSLGIFPRPWPMTSTTSNEIEISVSDVIKKFVLLGQIVAKALQDGRVLDIPFSTAFYKLILGKELSLYDIALFDPELGKTLLEFQAIVNRQKLTKSASGQIASEPNSGFRDSRIEDLCLDFSLPGYPDYLLGSEADHAMVTIDNLEEYVSLVVDATINTGISRQVEAFKTGFNQIFPVKHLHIFTEEELDRLLCGEHDSWVANELLDHIKFDHGYTASSPPIIDLLEIMQEFDSEQRRAFLQFVTGAPRLPPGGLATLNPKLTIVRKLCSNSPDIDLPSVMTCANYLKLPPYSSKEKMREKLFYAITEGQRSFHLS